MAIIEEEEEEEEEGKCFYILFNIKHLIQMSNGISIIAFVFNFIEEEEEE